MVQVVDEVVLSLNNLAEALFAWFVQSVFLHPFNIHTK